MEKAFHYLEMLSSAMEVGERLDPRVSVAKHVHHQWPLVQSRIIKYLSVIILY